MSLLQMLALLLMVAALTLGMWRFFQGPTSADRVVAADTLSVIVTAGLAWLAMSLQNPLYLDVALVYGALAFVGVVALARAMEGGSSASEKNKATEETP